MQKIKNAKLTSGPIIKTLSQLTLPMLLGIFAMSAFNLVDAYFIGKLGTKQLAAISFTFPVVFVIASVAHGLGIGTSSVISRAIGEGDHHKVQRLTTDSLSLSLLIVGIFIILGILTIEPLFKLLGASKTLMPYIKQYMQIWYPGVLFVIVPMVGNNAIRATGDTKTPGMIMIIAVVVNIILDPLLIFGIDPFPKLGIAGAALATVFARMTTLSVSLWILAHREKMLIFEKPRLKEVLNSWKKILFIGLPAAGTNMIIPLSIGIITRMISVYGPAAVAAFGVASRIEMFSLSIIMALGSVLGPFIGQNWGAKKYIRVHEGIKYSQIFSLIWGCIVFVIFLFFAKPIALLFNKDKNLTTNIVLYLHIVSLSLGLHGILALISSALNVLHKPFHSAFLVASRVIILYIPLALIGSHLFKLKGIFWAASIANILTGIISYFMLKKILSKNLKISTQ